MTQELLTALGAGGGAGSPRGVILSEPEGRVEGSEKDLSTAPLRTSAQDDREETEAFLPQRGRMSAQLTGEGEESDRDADGETLSLITRSAGASPAGGSTDAADPIRAHFDALWAASEALAAEFDDFDPEAALRDPDFLRLTAPGLGVEPRRAWLALHPESLQRRTADALRRSLASIAARPREGGRGGALPERDYRSLSRTEQQRLKERIHRAAALGEKIYP